VLVVFDEYALHLTGDMRRHVSDVTLDLRVVGHLFGGASEEGQSAAGSSDGRQNWKNDEGPAPGSGLGVSLRRELENGAT
jgi:hypothetical protein